MKFILKIFFLSLLFITSCANAFNAHIDSTLTLTIVNNTDSTLTFSGVTKTSADNLFNLNIPEVLPGGSTTVLASTYASSGIAGEIHFKDNEGNTNLLKITDPNQINSNQYGNFLMDNDHFVSFVSEQTLNPDKSPQSLTWTAATVVIQDKIHAV